MLLNELLTGIQDFVLAFLPDTGVNCGSIPDLVEGLILAKQFKLEVIEYELVNELNRSLKDVPNIPDVVQNLGAFKRLPVSLLMDVILCGEGWGDYPSTQDEFYAFMFWNEISEDDKMEIVEHFEEFLDDFTAEELLSDVKKSGLFSAKIIDDRDRV